tara:strand:- start:97 stop:723 length:627 start_codon:yes stop_codon:yes gene_type:complete
MEDIFWGNLYQHNEEQANNLPSKYKPVAEYFSSDEFIFPNIQESGKEIQLLISAIENDNKSINNTYLEIDRDAFKYYRKFAQDIGIKSKDANDTIKFISSNISPLTLDLKRYWNRARPYQYAYLLDLPIYPSKTISGGTTPSYPSGHSLQAIAFNKILSKKYPNKSVLLDELENQVHQSRIALGVHFPSDINFSIQIGEYLSINNMWM